MPYIIYHAPLHIMYQLEFIPDAPDPDEAIFPTAHD